MPSPTSAAAPTSFRLLIVAAIAAAAGFAYLFDSAHTHAEQQHAALTKYLQSHQCVVADVSRRVPSSYRCDLPKPGTYVSAAQAFADTQKMFAQ